MYKKFFMGIAAMAALTLVSCSSDDLDSFSDNSSKNEAISFDGYLGRSAVAVNGSRGSVETKETLKTDGFGVFGNYNSTGGQNFGSNLFDNVKVYSSSTADPVKWTYDNTKYWPAQGHIDFLAYAPYVANTVLNTTPDGSALKKTSKINFTVVNTIADQKDLLWAHAEDQKEANKTVTFTFNHALAKIGYKVKLNNAYSNATITLKKITLAGSADEKTNAFYTAGTIDLSKTSSTDLWATSSTDAKQNFKWFSGTHDLGTTDYSNPATDYLFVIPQDFSKSTAEGGTKADKLFVIVEYTIKYTNHINSEMAEMTSTVSSQIKKNFEQGKAYTINLNIGLTPIEFNAEVNDWDPKDGESIDASWN